jgi:protein disulfide-isomerase A6
MARWSYLLLASLTILGVHAESSVLDLIPKNFDQVVLKSKTPGLVEFFAPWCGHCKNLAPIYEELGKAFAHSDKVHVSKVDADEHKALGKRFNVQGFPTLLWFNGKSDKPETYEGARQFDDLAAFITKKTGIRPKVQKETTHVEMLNDKTFYDAIGGHKDVFVAFTAPWCGRMCSEFAPIPRDMNIQQVLTIIFFLVLQIVKPLLRSGRSLRRPSITANRTS